MRAKSSQVSVDMGGEGGGRAVIHRGAEIRLSLPNSKWSRVHFLKSL